MEIKAGYKQTELGIIPDDWNIHIIADVCELVVDCKNRTPLVVDNSDYAVMRTPNVRNGKFIWDDLRYTDEKSFHEYTVRAVPQAGDIVITREAPLGEVCLVPPDIHICLGQRLMMYRPDHIKVNTYFLLSILMSSSVQKNLQKKIGGSTVGHAKVDDIRYLEVPIPPTLSEQNAIGNALKDADALIENLEQLLGKKRQVKLGAMQELFNGKRRLAGFSGEWKLKKLGELSEMSSGGTPPSSNLDYYDGDIPWVSISDMTKCGKFISVTDRNLSIAGLNNSSAQMFPVGTVLYAMYASLGECSVAKISLCTSQAILGIRVKPGLLSNEFLYYFLNFIKPQVKTIGQ